MKKLFTLLPLCLLFCAYSTRAQIFWTENFESGSTSGLGVASYSGPNGTWTETNFGGSGSFVNAWYVSCAEQGHITGECGDICGASSGLGATLHVGSNLFIPDGGATYFAGPGGGATNKRAESPTINCSGRTGITLSFYYIENGDGTNDNATLYYSADGGTTWTLLVDIPKSPDPATTPCDPQGQWAHYSISLPAVCNNNPNVKLGFLWVNNADGAGTDPSFAVDSMSLATGSSSSGPTASFTTTATTVCQDSCITFTNTSTGTIDSFRWVAMGVLVPTASAVVPVCFTFTGTFPVTLRVYGGGTVDSQTTMITVNPAPHPTITRSGSTLTVSGTYTTYQWYKNDTAITGATTNSYTYTGFGSYYVIVDSGGCKGMSNTIMHTVGVNSLTAPANRYFISQTGPDMFILGATSPATADMDIQVYDATGRLMASDKLVAGADRKQFFFGNLSSGVYIVKVGNAAVLKWIKQ